MLGHLKDTSNAPLRVKKVFSTRCAQFFELQNLQKTVLIERERGFLPRSLFPRCSILQAKSTFTVKLNWGLVKKRKDPLSWL